MIKIRQNEGECPCYICPEVFDSRKDLRLHSINSHKGDNDLICTECSTKLKDISSLRRHIKTVHKKVKQYVCSLCKKKYSHKYDLENHFRNKHNHNLIDERYTKCPECNLCFAGNAKLNEHMVKKHQKTVDHIKCPYCIKIFFDPIYLKQHFRKVHCRHSGLLFVCEYCRYAIDIQQDITCHMEVIHNWTTVFFCTRKECSEFFDSDEKLKAHLETHPKQNYKKHDEEIFKCWHCDESFSDRFAVINHLTDTHNCFSVLECKSCHSFFKSEDDLIGHRPCSNTDMSSEYIVDEIEENLGSSETDHSVPRYSKRQKIVPSFRNSFHVSPPSSPKGSSSSWL